MTELFRESCEADGDDFPLEDTNAIKELMRTIAEAGAVSAAEAAQTAQDRIKRGQQLSLFVSPTTLTPAGMAAYGQLARLGLVSGRSELIANCPEHSREHDASAWADPEWRAALQKLIASGDLASTGGASVDCPTECGDDELDGLLARYSMEKD